MNDWVTGKEFKELVGKTFSEVSGKVDGDMVEFTLKDGSGKYFLHHNQDCCENVRIQDICGELSDLIDSPIVQAEENSSADLDRIAPIPARGESCTWTFYRIATAKGQVVLRWLGESDGYYSERVDLAFRS